MLRSILFLSGNDDVIPQAISRKRYEQFDAFHAMHCHGAIRQGAGAPCLFELNKQRASRTQLRKPNRPRSIPELSRVTLTISDLQTTEPRHW